MLISFADFYYNNISDKKLFEIKSFLNKEKTPTKNLDHFLGSLKEKIAVEFKIKKIDFPYYHYYPNSLYQKEQILIDVSINDKLDWQVNDKSRLNIPEELEKLLTKYQKLSAKEPVDFNTGYYRTKNKTTRDIEEKIIVLSDEYFDVLKEILLSPGEWQKKTDAAYLISYTVKHEKEAIRSLIDSLKDKDHAVHNAAARSLFPKIFVKKTSIQSLRNLLTHHNPYCQNKFLGIIAGMNKKRFPRKEIEKRTKYSQMIVSQPAKMLIDKLK